MADLGKGLLRFRAYGPSDGAGGPGGEVSASVFASKLTALVRALRAADMAVNGGSAHEYTIAKLHTSDPTAILREVPSANFQGMFEPASGVEAFSACVEAVMIGSSAARNFGKCAAHIATLARPTKQGLAYSAVWTEEDKSIRLDSFLSDRARAAVAPPSDQVAIMEGRHEWFKGVAFGSFDGSLDVVDARGAFPQVQLTLTAGGKTIDCVCRAEDIGVIGASLKQRVRVTGRAIYDGTQGLPIRVEATEIAPVKGSSDFTRWRSAFEPFEPAEWGVE